MDLCQEAFLFYRHICVDWSGGAISQAERVFNRVVDVHLTNVAVQKTAPDYDPEKGSKWSVRQLRLYLTAKHGQQLVCISPPPVPCGAGAPLFPSPLVHLLPHLFPLFYFSLSFSDFTYFLHLSIPSLSTRIVPLRFRPEVVGGDRTCV